MITYEKKIKKRKKNKQLDELKNIRQEMIKRWIESGFLNTIEHSNRNNDGRNQ